MKSYKKNFDDDIIIRKTGNYYTVCNKSYNATDINHCHFDKFYLARTIKKLVERFKIPKGDWMLESAIRLTINKDYKDMLLKEQNKRIEKENV